MVNVAWLSSGYARTESRDRETKGLQPNNEKKTGRFRAAKRTNQILVAYLHGCFIFMTIYLDVVIITLRNVCVIRQFFFIRKMIPYLFDCFLQACEVNFGVSND